MAEGWASPPKRQGLVVEMMIIYVLFSTLNPIGLASKLALGELADLLMMAPYLWPYPLALALQRWVPTGLTSVLCTFVVGPFIVFVSGLYLGKRFRSFFQVGWRRHVCSIFMWYVPLFIVQAAVIFIAWLSGWPIGE